MARRKEDKEGKEIEDENYWHGIKRFAGDDDSLPNFDKEVEEYLDHKGGKPWIDIYKNEAPDIVDGPEGNLRAIADAIRFGSLDPTDATKAGATPPASFYTLAYQTILRASIEKQVYGILFQATKDEARSAVEEIDRTDGHLVRDKLYSLWGKQDTSDRQKLISIFQAGISNPDGKTKMTMKDNVKMHIEGILHLQSRIKDLTPLAQRATDDILKPGTAWTIIRASLVAMYGPTLAAFDDTLEERADINAAINASLVAIGAAPILKEPDEKKYKRLRKRLHNFYEAKKREWEEEGEEKTNTNLPAFCANTPGTPALYGSYVSPPVDNYAPGGYGNNTTGGGKGGGKGYGKGSGHSNHPQEQCFNFTHTGTCRFGAKCRNRHDPPGTPAEVDRRPTNICYKCGYPGHIARNCPTNRPRDQAEAHEPATKRAKSGQAATLVTSQGSDREGQGPSVSDELYDFIAKNACLGK
jgi:hypothetical protein